MDLMKIEEHLEYLTAARKDLERVHDLLEAAHPDDYHEAITEACRLLRHIMAQLS